jgi:hypothetical protein
MLIGCREKPPRYCVDNNWNVSDQVDCERSDPGHHWHYGGGHGYLPIGTHITGGSSVVPAGGFSTPSSESGISRGGIGHAGEAASGGHGGGEGGGGE